MFHQHGPQNKNYHTSSPLGINLLLWEANLFSLTPKVKSNTAFILTYETLMVGHPCNRADSVLRAHICQVLLKQRNEPHWPLPSTQVSTHSQTMVAKTEHSNPEMTHPYVHKCVFLSHTTVGASTLKVQWVTPECKHHPLSVNPFLNYHSQKISKLSLFPLSPGQV